MAAGGMPAHALSIKDAEVVRIPRNIKTGTRSYVFEKPPNFRQYSNPLDPSGRVFRNTNDTTFSFAIRIELRPNATTEFAPEIFINDYRTKFTNSSGSEFELIKGGGKPDRIDEQLGTIYYEVEYIVRTQLGFSFDSVKTLHFKTVFVAAKESLYILNIQVPQDNWIKDKPVVDKLVSSFAVTS